MRPEPTPRATSTVPSRFGSPAPDENFPLLGEDTIVEQQPFFAILDEATAALDVRAEVICYTALQKRGIGVLSVSLRPSLLPILTDRLLLYKIVKIKIYRSLCKTTTC